MIFRAIAFATLMILSALTPAASQTRVALVVGNAAYQNASMLANPVNDATRVAEKLSVLGFDVMLQTDLNGQAFRIALGDFSERALQADIALVFYAGHGIEMGGRNYLIPVDSEMRSEATAQFETVALDQVLQAVRGAKTLGIVMLDACRDNPFGNSMTRSSGTRAVSRGLAPVSVEGEGGIVVSFAAEAGSTADDGDGTNSPYTEALLETLDEPGLEVGRMFRTLRAKVREKSGGRQVPVEQAQLPDTDVFITPAVLPSAEATLRPKFSASLEPAEEPAAPEPSMVFFDAVRANDSAKLAEFVALYPDHPRAADAQRLIESIEDDAMWKMVAADGSEAAMRRYILVFPAGAHVHEATAALEAHQAARQPATPPAAVQAERGNVAPSFDCGLARTEVEVAICSNAELALQDHGNVAAFRTALALGRVTKSAQRDWIKLRDATCAGRGQGVYDCVYQVTAARIAELGG